MDRPFTPLLSILVLCSSTLSSQEPGASAEPPLVSLDEIEVTASHSILREEPVSAVALSREQIEKLPHFGDDLFRAVSILPGTSSQDFSSAFNVRGGFNSEVLTRIDGVEIFEPFHLKDFQGVFSILDPKVTSGVDLTPGGYAAEFGDRMTGVLDLTTVRPTALRTEIGASFSNLWVGTAGTFAEGKGRWTGSLRRGFLDLVLALASADEDEDDDQPSPRYWDVFGKVGYDVHPSHAVSLQILGSEDTLSLEDLEDDDPSLADTAYGNTYLWATHQGILSSQMFVDSALSVGRLDRDRHIEISEADGVDFAVVRDEQDSKVFTLRQDWNYQLSERQYLKSGFEARRWDSDYDYLNLAQLPDPINDPRFLPGRRQTEFADQFSSSQYTLYAADRFRLHPRLTTELGLRWDRQTLTDEDEVSPRVHLVYDLQSGGVLRAGWGYYFQSQRPYELRVEFGETEFQTSQRAEHWTLGYETDVGKGLRLRADAYRRSITDPQTRYETLFDPFAPFPEVRIDLIKIPAETADSNGIELLLRSRQGAKFNWWLTYTLSKVEDTVLEQTVPRSIDQTHAVTAVASWRPAAKWSLTWVWTYHTGWPSTPVAAELGPAPDGDTFIDYTVGRFYSDRLDDYARLDFRASRIAKAGPGELTLFVDIRNLFDRENPRGLDITNPSYRPQPDGRVEVVFPTEAWLPILPSFGVSYRF
jgi:hypothetical protein